MDAMILAAGLGTRLRPVTHTTPKALIEVDGVPMIERVARRLIAAGADRILVNASHLAEKVDTYVREADWQTPDGYTVETTVSRELGQPLETGGGLKRAASWFRRKGPFLLHNADMLTTVDLEALWRVQRDAHDGRLATLAVAPAWTDRALLFDTDGLAGYTLGGGEPHLMRDLKGEERLVDFCGVQACAPEVLDVVLAEPSERFSIMDIYLRLSKAGRHIGAFDGPGTSHRFLDIGTPKRLAEAQNAVRAGEFT